MAPLSLRLIAAERTTIFVQRRRYWRLPKQISTYRSEDVFCITSRQLHAPPWQNITACGVPQKTPTDNIQTVRPLAPITKTVAPHINLCESAHKNKKSKHNNQPNASIRSRCRRPYPRRGQPGMLGRHQPPTEAKKR